jgi:hypothetical protein
VGKPGAAARPRPAHCPRLCRRLCPGRMCPSEAHAKIGHMKINRTKGALYLVCISRAGYREGAKLIEFIELWRRTVQRHEGPINIEQFIAMNGRHGRRNTFRLVRLFRDTFPQLGRDGLPQDLMAPLIERLAAEIQDDEQ